MSANVTAPQVYILILNWNGWRDTVECLESVFKIHYPAFRVIVCDNQSEDNSIGFLRMWAEGNFNLKISEANQLKDYLLPPVPKPIPYMICDDAEIDTNPAGDNGGARFIIIRNRCNYGFAGGNNIGLRYILARNDFDYVWLLNNDTVVAPDALTHLVERMAESQDTGICGSTLLFYHNPKLIQALGGAKYHHWLGFTRQVAAGQIFPAAIAKETVESKINYIIGASMFVSKRFLLDTGLMCEDYFLYFEELDWAVRAKGRYSLGYAPKSVVFHKEGASIGCNRILKQRSLYGDYYLIINKIRFTRKFFPYALPTIYLGILAVLCKRMKDRMWKHVWLIIQMLISIKVAKQKITISKPPPESENQLK